MKEQGLIQVKNLSKTFTVSGWLKAKNNIEAVQDVTFFLKSGETLALVGESGSGKSTVGRIILGLVKPSAGEVTYRGVPIHSLKGDRLRAYRKAVQAVFQDPHSSLNPRMRIGDIIAEPLYNFGYRGELRKRLGYLLEVVGLSADFADRYPHQCSGGQKQRVTIARALAAEPEAIILDEPLSALDITIQTQIITLLKGLQAEHQISYLLITHDLRAVKAMADRVVVMYKGSIVETATTEQFFCCPGHTHSRALIDAIPVIGGLQSRKDII